MHNEGIRDLIKRTCALLLVCCSPIVWAGTVDSTKPTSPNQHKMGLPGATLYAPFLLDIGYADVARNGQQLPGGDMVYHTDCLYDASTALGSQTPVCWSQVTTHFGRTCPPTHSPYIVLLPGVSSLQSSTTGGSGVCFGTNDASIPASRRMSVAELASGTPQERYQFYVTMQRIYEGYWNWISGRPIGSFYWQVYCYPNSQPLPIYTNPMLCTDNPGLTTKRNVIYLRTGTVSVGTGQHFIYATGICPPKYDTYALFSVIGVTVPGSSNNYTTGRFKVCGESMNVSVYYYSIETYDITFRVTNVGRTIDTSTANTLTVGDPSSTAAVEVRYDIVCVPPELPWFVLGSTSMMKKDAMTGQVTNNCTSNP